MIKRIRRFLWSKFPSPKQRKGVVIATGVAAVINTIVSFIFADSPGEFLLAVSMYCVIILVVLGLLALPYRPIDSNPRRRW